MIKPKILLFYLTAVLISAVKCDSPDPFEIPDVYINFEINIQNDVQYYSLQSAGNSIEVDKRTAAVTALGYDDNGIIIFNNGGEFYAYDRTCPHEFPTSVAVDGNGGGSAECPTCNSVFLLSALGYPALGSAAKYPLKEYRTEFNTTTGYLRVFNY